MSFFHRLGIQKWDESLHPRDDKGRFADSGESPTAAGEKEYADAVAARRDAWVPGGGGKEVPSVDKNGRRYLRVFNPGTGKHGNLDLGTDIVEEDRNGSQDYEDYVSQMEALAQHRAYRRARRAGGDDKAARRAMLEEAEQHFNKPMPQAGDKALMDDRNNEQPSADPMSEFDRAAMTKHKLNVGDILAHVEGYPQASFEILYNGGLKDTISNRMIGPGIGDLDMKKYRVQSTAKARRNMARGLSADGKRAAPKGPDTRSNRQRILDEYRHELDKRK